MHDGARAFRLCWEREDVFFLWVKAGSLNPKRLVALPEEFLEGGERCWQFKLCRKRFPSVFTCRRLFFVCLRIGTLYILGLIKAKTQEGRDGGELGNITSWSRI